MECGFFNQIQAQACIVSYFVVSWNATLCLDSSEVYVLPHQVTASDKDSPKSNIRQSFDSALGPE